MKNSLTFFLAFLLFVALCCPASAVSVSDFSDVPAGSWFYDSVKFVTDRGLFNGTTTATFSPDQTMTRGMFITVLGRFGRAEAKSGDFGTVSADDVNLRSGPSTDTPILANVKKGTVLTVTGTADDSAGLKFIWYRVTYKGTPAYVRMDLFTLSDTQFSDVNKNMYYAPYIKWSVENKITSAVGDSFYPEKPITREYICLWLKNFSDFKHLKLTAGYSTTVFSDTSTISQANREAVSLMQSVGIVNGYEDGSFRPKNCATRAEVSTVLMRFVSAVSYMPVLESPYDQSGNYVFGRELYESAAVSESYFSDAAFIGHSIVVGMKSYFGLSNADFWAVNGASCRYLLNTYSSFPLGDDNTGSLSQALEENSYGKVYIMLGTNELGSSPDTFKANLSGIVDLVRSTQPKALIYLYSVTPVTQTCSEADESINRDNIIAFNSAIKTLCAEKRCYYLNVFDCLVNSDGFLPEENASADGIHMKGSLYSVMKIYTLTHTA